MGMGEAFPEIMSSPKRQDSDHTENGERTSAGVPGRGLVHRTRSRLDSPPVPSSHQMLPSLAASLPHAPVPCRWSSRPAPSRPTHCRMKPGW